MTPLMSALKTIRGGLKSTKTYRSDRVPVGMLNLVYSNKECQRKIALFLMMV